MYEDRIALSVFEAAKATGYSQRLIRKAIQFNRLKANRPGGIGDYRILREDLLAWLRSEGIPQKVRPGPTRALTA